MNVTSEEAAIIAVQHVHSTSCDNRDQTAPPADLPRPQSSIINSQCIKFQERQLMALYLGFFICSTKCSEVPHREGDIFRLWCSTAKCCCWLCLMKSGWLDAHSASYCRGNAVLKFSSLLKENSLHWRMFIEVLKPTSVDFPKTSNL